MAAGGLLVALSSIIVITSSLSYPAPTSFFGSEAVIFRILGGILSKVPVIVIVSIP